jgi:hypothetical protein
MSINEKEFKVLFEAVERALRNFEAPPAEPGFDREIYEELRRVRETLLRAHRDQQDPKVKQGSPSPFGTP